MKPHQLMIVALMVCALIVPCRAQEAVKAPQQKVYRLKVTPVAPARPALGALLMPGVSERTGGDGAPLYFQAIVTWDNAEQLQKAADLLDMEKPFNLAEAKNLKIPESAMRLTAKAARRDRCDWQTPLREDGFMTLLPELAKLRGLSSGVLVQARIATAEKNYPETIKHLRTALALAKHAEGDPILIRQLICVAIASRTLDQAQEMIGSPDSPNLYWGLVNLPRPFSDSRLSMQWERASAILFFSSVRDGDFSLLSKEQFVRDLNMLGPLTGATGTTGGPTVNLAATAILFKLYPDAKRFFIERGAKKEEIEARPVHQVVAEFMVRDYLEQADEMYKLSGLPPHLALAELDRADAKFKEAMTSNVFNPFRLLLPALNSAQRRIVSLDRRIASMACVEAVRAYAASHNGKLPASLDDLTETPALPDPATSKPFKYEVRGNTAIIDVPALRGDSADRGWRYEISL